MMTSYLGEGAPAGALDGVQSAPPIRAVMNHLLLQLQRYLHGIDLRAVPR